MPATALLARLRSAGSAFLTTLRRGRDPRARVAAEFRASDLLRQMRAPMQSSSAWSWSLEAILSARDDLLRGSFAAPVKMAASARTDDAIFTATKNRIAPARALGVRLVAADGARGARVAADAQPLFGEGGASVSRETIADINLSLADLGVGVGKNDWTAREDGSRLDLVHHAWPMEFVAWDPVSRLLYTSIDTSTGAPVLPRSARGSCFVDIVPNMGTWAVYQSVENLPWTKDAALLAGALVWARHAFGSRDWSKGSASHGNAKILGTLPEGVDLQVTDEDGNVSISPQAEAYLALLGDLSSQDSPFGLQPTGAKTDWVFNNSRSWEVWERLCVNAEKAAARVWCGTDAALGSQGGAPGIDVAALFGVSSTILQADLGALERGLHDGVLAPWAAINYGSSDLAPRREFIVPDPDADAEQTERTKRQDAYLAALVQLQAAGLLTQENADKLAERYNAEPMVLAVTGEVPAQSGAVPLRAV